MGYHSKFNDYGEYLGPTQCPPGYFGGFGSHATCQPCPRGSYSRSYGAVNIESCTLCPRGTFSLSVAATDDYVCRTCGEAVRKGFYCPAGNDEQDGIPCPARMFCEGADAQPEVIPEDFYLLGGVALTKCPDNFHLPFDADQDWYDASAHPCIPNDSEEGWPRRPAWMV